MFSFCSLFSNFDRWRGIQEHMACGSELETQDAKSIVLDIRCDLSDREHLSHQEAGGRGGVSCDTTRKTLGGNANGMTKKKKNNTDQMTCTFPGQCQNIQWFNWVITRCSSPNTTRWELGGASDSSRKNPQRFWKKIMTWQNTQRTKVTFRSHPWSPF